MIWVYLLILVASLVTTALLLRRGSKYSRLAGAAAIVAVLSILGGFSIGNYLAVIAVVLLAFALPHLQDRDRST